MSDPDPLASFDPQLIDGRLHLTVHHMSPVALNAGLAAFCAIGAGCAWIGEDLLDAALGGLLLTVGAVASLVAVAAYAAKWSATTTLVVGTGTLRWGGVGYRRYAVDGFALRRSHLQLWIDHGRPTLSFLRHDHDARVALLQLLQAWNDDPCWDPSRPRQLLEKPSLDRRLARLRPTVGPDGYAIPLRSRGELGPHFEKLWLAWFMLLNFGAYLWIFAAVVVAPYSLWRIRARGSVVLAPGGFTIGGGARIHWSQVDTAVLDEAGDVCVVLIDGTKHTLRPLYPVGASALAQVITERTLPNQTASEVPTPLHQARRAASRETL